MDEETNIKPKITLTLTKRELAPSFPVWDDAKHICSYPILMIASNGTPESDVADNGIFVVQKANNVLDPNNAGVFSRIANVIDLNELPFYGKNDKLTIDGEHVAFYRTDVVELYSHTPQENARVWSICKSQVSNLLNVLNATQSDFIEETITL